MWSSPVELLALKLLDRLEEREYELLTWGFLDGGFTPDELEAVAQSIIDASPELCAPNDLIDILRDRALLVQLHIGERHLWRSRFAEAVRLFARLKQMFQFDGWNLAPNLVADYRLAIRPRRYPKRDVSPSEVQTALSEVRPLSALEKNALTALLQRDGQQVQLSRFQVQAAARLREGLPESRARGTVVCAGTGTGKTIAFYLPALMTVAGLVDATHWTKALAIYPRNELLKDQFSEAYGQARRLDESTRPKGRKIRIGAFFGLTPYNTTSLEQATAFLEKQWGKSGDGYTCPFLRCPQCEGDLIWKRADVAAGREQLHCHDRNCAGFVAEDEVLLTRRRMQAEPPDVLFTTTEMLNRLLSSTNHRKLFGIGVKKEQAVRFVLLDEAHTYGGTHGAQVALLLRRWRKEAGHATHWVGLSATLADAPTFFSTLTGLGLGSISAIAPGGDMEEQGREYQLVLRGDPVSGTSLLSTSIQAAMLLGRVMDTGGAGTGVPISGGVFGRRVFAFTDDLDVTNRFYHNLLDAEARDSWGNPRNDKEPLAAVRSSHAPQELERLSEGQNWLLCERIGHPLDSPGHRLAIGRVSSQDAGVESERNVVVATASLEVGYNDPAVGAVMQHKAPRDAASFLQRKGRAGRQRITRPWTVVVLSDYGRDRLAYQGYEQMFDPVLDKPALPTDNRYILRMQATFAFIDWMTSQMPFEMRWGHVWNDFSKPASPGTKGFDRQKWQANFIVKMLENGARRQEFALHLQRALRISSDEVKALFWEPPRALMTAVLPTLWRRLTYGWRRLPREGEVAPLWEPTFTAPLPEFVPANLFSDLNVPEVEIIVPRGHKPGTPEPDPDSSTMSLAAALRELAPGRITRRFAVRHMADNHWIEPLDLVEAQQTMPLSEICQEWDEIGVFEAEVEGQIIEVRCVRPLRIVLKRPEKIVSNTSNARMRWRSQFLPPAQGEAADTPLGSLFEDWVLGVTFYTHNGRNPLRVRRFAIGSDANLRFQGGGEAALHISFEDEAGQAAALGVEQSVDGMAFRCRLPNELIEQMKSETLPVLRAAFFRHLVETDPQMSALANGNPFRLNWMAQIVLSVLLARALVSNCSLETAAQHYANTDWMPSIKRALDVIFGVLNIAAEDQDEPGDDSAAASGAPQPRLYASLRELAEKAEARQRLLELAQSLWEAPDATWDEWLRTRLKATLGGALLQACYAVAPQFGAGDLLLDLSVGVSSPEAPLPELQADECLLCITEGTIGGVGVVEEVMRQYIEDPRRFFLLVESALAPSDFEIVDAQLSRLVELSQTDMQVQDTFAEVRAAASNEELSAARRALMQTLLTKNILLTHPVMNSLNARLLRVGSSTYTDDLLARLLERWNQKQQELGIEIDARIFAYAAAVSPEFETLLEGALSVVGGDETPELRQRYSIFYSLLWPRGAVLRERALEAYNPYAPSPGGDASLLLRALHGKRQPISIHDADWSERAALQLTEQGLVQLTADRDSPTALQSAILHLVSQPVEIEFLRLFPYLGRLESTLEGYSATLHLQEALQ